MAPPQHSYVGPMALANSKYASPQQKAAALAASSSPFTPAHAAATTNMENVIATKEQIAAAESATQVLDVAQHNSHAQLAIAQGNVLKEEVEKHTARLSRTLSSTVDNTRRLLELIRESMPQPANSAVDTLWTELEQLFTAASDTKAALPGFLERQRNNMSLYYNSVLNETIRDTQDELNVQHKKVNIQHNLILEHQEAFQDYKAQTAAKLKELKELQERVSRLTLEKGNFRTEIDRYMHLLEQEEFTKAEDLRKVGKLQEELNTLAASKTELLAETEILRKTLEDVHGKMKVAEQEITDRFSVEIKSTAEQLMKETQKATSLNVTIKQLKEAESTARMEADKAQKENRALNEKYGNQAAEHAKAFMKLNEQTKQIDGLNIEVGRFQKENAELKQRLIKLVDFEMQVTELSQAKSTLLAQTTKLTTELTAAKDEVARAKAEVDNLLKKVETLNKEVVNMETENNDLLASQAESKKAMQAMQVLKNENIKLRAVGGSSTMGGEERVAMEEKIVNLETAVQEWTDLAKRSYKEYKDLLPTYKQADQYRRDALDKEDVIKSLKLELMAASASKTNGVGAGGDATYWKDKYEALLENMNG